MISTRKLLYKYKQDMGMSDDKFIKFCKRYATVNDVEKNVDSVVLELKRRYRDVPANLKRELKKEFTALAEAFDNQRCNKNTDSI